MCLLPCPGVPRTAPLGGIGQYEQVQTAEQKHDERDRRQEFLECFSVPAAGEVFGGLGLGKCSVNGRNSENLRLPLGLR